MTIQQRNSSEYSPEQRTANELSPEAIAAQGELHDAWNDTLYGSIEASQDDDGDIAIEDLGQQRVDMRRVAQGVNGSADFARIEAVELNETGLSQDITKVQAGVNEELGELGLEDGASRKDVANEVVAEALLEGQDEDSGRLDNEAQRDARNTTIATELDKAIRHGETEPLQHLAPSVAAKVTAWLGNIGERYGSAELAPNEDVAAVGAYIAFAEKISDTASGETIAYTDPITGEVAAESMDDVIMRVLDGDPEAAKLLSPEQYERIKDKQRDLEVQNGRFFSSKLDSEDQEMLVSEVRKALLAANAGRMALAA